jgi:hypothetical protein
MPDAVHKQLLDLIRKLGQPTSFQGSELAALVLASPATARKPNEENQISRGLVIDPNASTQSRHYFRSTTASRHGLQLHL